MNELLHFHKSHCQYQSVCVACTETGRAVSRAIEIAETIIKSRPVGLSFTRVMSHTKTSHRCFPVMERWRDQLSVPVCVCCELATLFANLI